MFTLILTATLAEPIAFEAITVPRARALHGQRTTITLVPRTPAYRWRGHTVIGPAEQPDGVSRTVVLRGDRLDVKEGEPLILTGTLELLRHPATKVGGVRVAAWTELRLTEK